MLHAPFTHTTRPTQRNTIRYCTTIHMTIRRTFTTNQKGRDIKGEIRNPDKKKTKKRHNTIKINQGASPHFVYISQQQTHHVHQHHRRHSTVGLIARGFSILLLAFASFDFSVAGWGTNLKMKLDFSSHQRCLSSQTHISYDVNWIGEDLRHANLEAGFMCW